jgi:hypothetical protein
MVSYSHHLQSGQITCYFDRTYHVLTTAALVITCDFDEITGQSRLRKTKSSPITELPQCEWVCDLTLRIREADCRERKEMILLRSAEACVLERSILGLLRALGSPISPLYRTQVKPNFAGRTPVSVAPFYEHANYLHGRCGRVALNATQGLRGGWTSAIAGTEPAHNSA